MLFLCDHAIITRIFQIHQLNAPNQHLELRTTPIS